MLLNASSKKFRTNFMGFYVIKLHNALILVILIGNFLNFRKIKKPMNMHLTIKTLEKELLLEEKKVKNL